MQRGGDLLDHRILSHHQVKPASEEVNVRIDLGRLSHDRLDARMRAAHHQHDAVAAC